MEFEHRFSNARPAGRFLCFSYIGAICLLGWDKCKELGKSTKYIFALKIIHFIINSPELSIIDYILYIMTFDRLHFSPANSSFTLNNFDLQEIVN